MIIEFDNVPISLDAMLPQNRGQFEREVKRACGITPKLQGSHRFEPKLLRKSIDARRKGNVRFVVSVAIDLPEIDAASLGKIKPRKGVHAKPFAPKPKPHIPDLSAISASQGFKRPVVIGAGPAGLFAALALAKAGLRPIVIERGKPAAERLQDVEAFAAGGKLDPNSNIQFGEGGAGTFSDGKLTTNTKSPHINYVLEEFVEAGAPSDILVDAKPHIGTDILPRVVTALREKAEALGAEFLFDTQLTGIGFEDDAAKRNRIGSIEVADVVTGETRTMESDAVFLAIGHSARDTFVLLKDLGIVMEQKPFAVGVRIEHLQRDMNRAQYGRFADHPALGAADYKLAVRVGDSHPADPHHSPAHHHAPAGSGQATRGVYTFCMCPGGTVVAASSEPGHLCVNGMSANARDGANSNSALLVEVSPDDLDGDDALAGVELQRKMESAAFEVGQGGSRSHAPYTAPAQTVGDFLARRHGNPSNTVVPTYPRGVNWADLRRCLPGFVADAMSEALPLLDRKLEGFADGQAVMTGVEPRSSSPVKVVRDKATLESISMQGLYPVGEGCGYAGGIMSAATDGIRCALAYIDSLQNM